MNESQYQALGFPERENADPLSLSVDDDSQARWKREAERVNLESGRFSDADLHAIVAHLVEQL
jgi:hypothetical protein